MTTRRLVGVVLLVAGVVASLVCVVWLVDPHGTQLADDNDPFGEPPALLSRIAGLVLALAVTALGSRLAFFPGRQR